jgi:hypothetical protein
MLLKLHTAISRLLRSPRTFYIVVGVLVLQSVWIALTARYPQAFDENYHFGLIQLHAHQLLPFFTHQPPDSTVYGALARDPSYLYHYLLSFPYRLLAHLTDSLTLQVIVLRLLNVAIFVGGLFIFRKLFRSLHISTALSNIVMLFFVLLPPVPLLAGQINYDNLMFAMTGLLFLLTVRYIRTLQSDSGVIRIPVLSALSIVLVGALGSIVKFPFAPIFFMTVVALVFMTRRAIRRSQAKTGVTGQPAAYKFVWPSKFKLIAMTVLTLLAVSLCVERYGINLVQYHNPVPECDAVLSLDECQDYSPWARDYLFASTYPRPTALGIIVYPWVWVHRTVYETMFTITSYFEPNGTVTYKPVPPLTIANYTAWTIISFGIILVVRSRKAIWSMRGLRVLLIISGFYVVILFVQNFVMYLHTGEAVAIHGRYLIPIYPVLFLPFVIGFQQLFSGLKSARYGSALLIVCLLLFLQGGGITGWIVSSDPSWYFQQSYPAAQTNWLAKDVLGKVVHH